MKNARTARASELTGLSRWLPTPPPRQVVKTTITGDKESLTNVHHENGKKKALLVVNKSPHSDFNPSSSIFRGFTGGRCRFLNKTTEKPGWLGERSGIRRKVRRPLQGITVGKRTYALSPSNVPVRTQSPGLQDPGLFAHNKKQNGILKLSNNLSLNKITDLSTVCSTPGKADRKKRSVQRLDRRRMPAC